MPLSGIKKNGMDFYQFVMNFFASKTYYMVKANTRGKRKMNCYRLTSIAAALFFIFLSGLVSTGFSAPLKDGSSSAGSSIMKPSGASTIKSSPGISHKKLNWDLSIEDIRLDKKGRIVIDLKNTGKDVIPAAVFKKIMISAGSGKEKVSKKLYTYDRKMHLRHPGKEMTWETGIIASGTLRFKAMIDTYNVLKESNETNNRKTVRLSGKASRPSLADKQVRAADSGIPSPQGPGNIEPRSLERGIKITSPAEGRQFFSGSTIHIKYHLQNQNERNAVSLARLTGVFLYLDGTQVASLDLSSSRPLIRPGKNTVEIDIPLTATPADGYTVTINAQNSSGETLFGISDRFEIKRRAASMNVTQRLRNRTRDEGITITSPRSGQRYMPGQTMPVRFSVSTVFEHWSPETRPTVFRVMLTRNSGTPVMLYEGGETEYDFHIPAETPSGDDYRIIVYGVEDSSWYGVAGMFSIGLDRPDTQVGGSMSVDVAPFLRLENPTGLITWHAGCSQRVVLRTNVTLDSVNLKLLTATAAGDSVIQSRTYSAGTAVTVSGQNEYTIFYQIPPDQGDNGRLGHYRLGVEQIGGEGLEVVSGNIWFYRAGYRIMRPVRGVYFWENFTVSWDATGCAALSYDIQLVRQPPGDSTVTTIRTGVSPSYTTPTAYPGTYTQTFSWPIPDSFERGTYTVRIIVHEKGGTTDVHESDAFYISER